MKIAQIPFLALVVTLVPHDIAEAQTKARAAQARETVVLQRVAVPGTDRELGMGIAEFPPNSSKTRQKAIGPETCFVLEGVVTVEVEGQQRKVFHAGESFQFPAMVVHQTTAGPEGARILATWVHTSGDQFNIPAPR
jgi:quercetin dioxygenase-like cupin family protein